MEHIKDWFSEIVDERHSGYTEHRLSDILIMVMCGVLCGIDELTKLVIYAKSRASFFSKHFGIEQIPSKSTFSRVLNMVDGDAVAAVMVAIMKENARELGDIIAVDGKAIRSTGEPGKPHSALQILTVYLTESGVVLGQKAIHEKTNEIPVFQEMLDFLDVSGKTITADAMHCQKETCRRIVAGGGHYIFGLKENQKSLHDDVALFLDSEHEGIESGQTIEKNGGRIEKRICRKICDINWLDVRAQWAGLQSAFSVRRVITAKGNTTDETCYYITSLDTTAQELLRMTRAHWKIESLHWLLDTTFSEDDCAILSENGQKTLNALRKLALFLHKQFLETQSPKSTIKASLFSCLLNDSRLCDILESL